jgi:hypothetical protein
MSTTFKHTVEIEFYHDKTMASAKSITFDIVRIGQWLGQHIEPNLWETSWRHEGDSIQFFIVRFVREEDYVLFTLTWC